MVSYTHKVAGGKAVTINGVALDLLDGSTTPADFDWSAKLNGGANAGRAVVQDNLGDWAPATGGVTGAGVIDLLDSFTYSNNGANAGAYQTYTFSALSPGETYEACLYVRMWDDAGTGRPLDLTFTNGTEVDTVTPLWEDRPANHGYASNHNAYCLKYAYRAQGSQMSIEATVPSGGNGSYHMYALTNEDTKDIPLFSTGVDGSGAVLAGGAADPHYQITADANGGSVPRAATKMNPHSAWLTEDAASGWIGAIADGTASVAGGDYVYETTFDLTGLDPSTARVEFRTAIDNNLNEVVLNGNPLGITDGGHAGWGPDHVIDSGFVAGINKLAFHTSNAGAGPHGFRAEIVSATALVPEPATLALAAVGLLGLRRRRQRA